MVIHSEYPMRASLLKSSADLHAAQVLLAQRLQGHRLAQAELLEGEAVSQVLRLEVQENANRLVLWTSGGWHERLALQADLAEVRSRLDKADAIVANLSRALDMLAESVVLQEQRVADAQTHVETMHDALEHWLMKRRQTSEAAENEETGNLVATLRAHTK